MAIKEKPTNQHNASWLTDSSFGSKHIYILVLLLTLAIAPLRAQVTVNTVIGGKLHTGVSAHDVALLQIGGIAYDAAGNLVVADQNFNLIRRIRTDGVIETLAGNGDTGSSGDGGPALNAAINQPAFPSFDAKGNLYFADQGNFRIRRIDPSGVISTIGGTGVAYQTGMDLQGPALSRSLSTIGAMAVDPAGNVYFTFAYNTDLIHRITTGGQLEIFAGIPHAECPYCVDGDNGPARVARIGARLLAADGKGNIFVSEIVPGSNPAFATQIRRIAADGTITRYAGFGPANGDPTQGDDAQPALGVYIYSVTAMSADSAGNLYFVQGPKPNDKVSQRIRRVDTGGVVNTLAGGVVNATTLDGPALQVSVAPAVIAADAKGTVAFTETLAVSGAVSGSVIRRITAQNVQTFAGDAATAAPDGIKPADAWLLNPTSITFNRAGELLIAEAGACLIRKIGTNGLLATVAGTGRCGAAKPGSPSATDDMAPPATILEDSQGRLYMIDRSGNSYLVTVDGKVSAMPSLPTSVGPGKLAFDGKGRTYIMTPNSLIRVAVNGNQETIVAAQSGSTTKGPGPTSLGAIAADAAGTVYFTGTYLGAPSDYVYRVNEDASVTPVYGSASNPLRLSSFTSLAIDASSNVWAGSTFVNSAGTFVLGRQDPGFSGDGGNAQSARFDASSIAFAPNGDLYLADGVRVRKLTGSTPNRPTIRGGGVVNAVSYAGGAISPGELVSIFGAGFAASDLMLNQLENNRVPTVLGRTKVLFDGYPGAIVGMTSTQINVFVPYYVVPGKSSAVRVQTDAAVSDPVMIPVVSAVPGLATADQSGSGPGAILNQDASINNSNNAATRGSVITLFGTGEGFVFPQLLTGDVSISTPLSAPVSPLTVTIGDVSAEVAYAGAAPMLPVGVFQINVKIPANIPAGAAAIKVSVGGISTANVVTVAVK